MKYVIFFIFALILGCAPWAWSDEFAPAITPLITPATGEVEALFEKANALFNQKDYQGCRNLLTPLVAENPMADFVPQARLILAEAQEDFDVSIAELREVSEQYDDLPQGMEAQKELGDRFLLADQYANAVDSYTEYLNRYEKSPMAVEVHYWLACAYLATSQNKQAIDQYQQVINKGAKTPWAAKALLGLGNAYFKIKKYSDAQNQYLRILDQYPLDSELNLVYLKLGETYELEKKWTQAYAAYETLVARFPKALEVSQAQTRMEELAKVHVEVSRFIASMPSPTPTLVLAMASPTGALSTPTVASSLILSPPMVTIQSIPQEAEQEETVDQPVLKPTPFHVQMGVYTLKSNVWKLQKAIHRVGYQCYVVTVKRVRDPYTFYKVRVGHFATRLAALRVAHILARRTKEKAIVVQE